MAAVALLQGACDRAGEPHVGERKLPAHLAPTLTALNSLGAIAFEQQSFSYRLESPCGLRIVTMLEGHETAVTLVDLEVAQFERFDFANSLGFALRLQNDATTPELYRAEFPNEIDRMLGLFRELQMACRSNKTARAPR